MKLIDNDGNIVAQTHTHTRATVSWECDIYPISIEMGRKKKHKPFLLRSFAVSAANASRLHVKWMACVGLYVRYARYIPKLR